MIGYPHFVGFGHQRKSNYSFIKTREIALPLERESLIMNSGASERGVQPPRDRMKIFTNDSSVASIEFQ